MKRHLHELGVGLEYKGRHFEEEIKLSWKPPSSRRIRPSSRYGHVDTPGKPGGYTGTARRLSLASPLVIPPIRPIMDHIGKEAVLRG